MVQLLMDTKSPRFKRASSWPKENFGLSSVLCKFLDLRRKFGAQKFLNHSLELRGAAGAGASSDDGGIKEQERLLPIANVGRIMKQILPANAKISKEAKETMQECVSEFISFITSEASEKCRKERRKTVNGDDICWALGTLGFDDYAGPIRRYLHKYRELEGERANQQDKASNSNSNININEEREEPAGSSYGADDEQITRNQALASISFKSNVNERSNSFNSRRY